MGKFIDMDGQRFGRLTVLKSLKGGVCLCLCDCGNKKLLNKYTIRRGETKSCGCLKSDVSRKHLKRLNKSKTGTVAAQRRKDLSGQRFGRLTAIKPVGKTKHNSVIWLCGCNCGNTTEVSQGNLSGGSTRSCGCLKVNMNRLKLRAYGYNRDTFTYNRTYKDETTRREVNNEKRRRECVLLTDAYVKRIIQNDLKIKLHDISQRMVDEKKSVMKFKRELKKVKETANELYGN